MNITDQMVVAAQAVVPSLTADTVRQMLAAGLGAASSEPSEQQLLLAGVARILRVVDRPSSDLYRTLRAASGPARDIAE